MKTKLSLIAVSLVAASGLYAQDAPREGRELLDLFERMNRAGATEADLQQFLRNNQVILEPEASAGTGEDASQEPRRKKQPREAGERAETASRPMIGVLLQPLDPGIRGHFDLADGTGMLVERVMDGGSAAQAGIGKNDIIVTANGSPVGNLEDLRKIVESATPDHPAVDLEVIQKGQRSKITVPVRFPDAAREMQEPSAGPEPRNSQRPLIEMKRRLDRQQKQIEELRREVEKLKREVRKDRE